VKRTSVLLAAISLIIGSEAQAQNWKATTEPAASNRSSCPTRSATYEFSVIGTELSVRAPTGHIHRGPVAPDGTVSLEYASASAAAGQITISGNARTKQLQQAASSSPGCTYNLAAEAADNWVATKSLANGIYRNCGDPPWSDYAIEVRGKIVTGMPTNPSQRDLPIRVDLRSLQPDGSGRVSFMPPNGVGPVQFDFEPGSGPRKITYGRVNIECRWLLQPR
jgi:hypothetical protein